MSEKGSGEALIQDGALPYSDNPTTPRYPAQPYVQPPQPGFVFQGQPAQQGYVVNPPPPYGGVQYNTTGMVVMPAQPAEDHMIAAILVTLFCFFPTGILAIMRASEAKAAASYGDMQASERHSQSAKKMIKISIIAGILTTIVLIGLIIVYIAVISHIAARNMDDYYD